jgi:hypothetical protein
MTTTKRTIRGERFDVEKLVSDALAAARPDAAAATAALQRMGHANPSTELVSRYARDAAVLAELQRMTGAAFSGQIGKIGFDNTDKAIEQVNAYLNRRNAGHRSRWGK